MKKVWGSPNDFDSLQYETKKYYIDGKKVSEKQFKQSNKKKLFAQIPDEIIKNELFKIDAYTFSVYALLKHLHFRNFNNNEMQIDHNKLKHKLYISDNRTLKKALTELHKQQIILEYINKLPTKGALKLTFDPVPFKSKKFTQLPVTVFNKIEHIGVIGLRLLFYYESFINRKDKPEKQFAFPAIETTAETLKINKETVIKYNEILRKNKLLKIQKHQLMWDGEYDNDDLLYVKYNNHYFVRLENI